MSTSLLRSIGFICNPLHLWFSPTSSGAWAAVSGAGRYARAMCAARVARLAGLRASVWPGFPGVLIVHIRPR